MKTGSLVSISTLVLAVLLLAGNCATTTYATDEHPMVVQREVEFQDTKSNLFLLANEWMEMTLTGTEEGVDYRNHEEGVIVGRGVITQPSSNGFDVVYDFRYEFTIEIEDYKAIATIKTNYGMGEIQENVTIITEAHLMPRKAYEE